MKPLYSVQDFETALSTDMLSLECQICQTPFDLSKHQIQRVLNSNNPAKGIFCSKKCKFKSQETKEKVTCSNCTTPFKKRISEIKKSKSGNHFCSKSCATTFNNKTKAHGTRRSKLENWLEAKLRSLYPLTQFQFNKKDAIGSELDIYIPELRLAFELNGIFHCEPIFGQEKLNQIQANDEQKFKACYDNNITLCMIDTSKQKYFKESTSQEFLDIIVYHINLINFLANLPK